MPNEGSKCSLKPSFFVERDVGSMRRLETVTHSRFVPVHISTQNINGFRLL